MPATSAEKRKTGAAKKSSEAFRTISEAAGILEIPAHVLRFWESKFAQIKPVKRGGGRRYYRPSDIELLCGIRNLLHKEGYTIKGVQKILREKGVKYVAALGPIDLTERHAPPVEELSVPCDDTTPDTDRTPRLVVPEPETRADENQVDLFAHAAAKSRRPFPPDPERRARADEIRTIIGKLARVRDRMASTG
ncbi:MAG: MerR family transcriptional regulator [Pseudomonadota bacterium]